jgi:hypothetical protein
VGLYIDICYGQVALSLLPEAACRAPGVARDDLTTWPVSTDWGLGEGHGEAFAAHWGPWDHWFAARAGRLSDPGADPVLRGLLRVACEAMREAVEAGLLGGVPRAEGFGGDST